MSDIKTDNSQTLVNALKEIESLKARVSAYEIAVDTMDQATRRAYISGAATVHHIKQIVAEAENAGGES